jgi:preprotein translocase subunit SecE
MSSEKKDKVEKTEQSSSKPVKKKVKGSNRFARWFREMRSELKKVVWPTPKQIMNHTFVALTVMAVFAVVIWGIDYVGNQIFQAIRLLGSG